MKQLDWKHIEKLSEDDHLKNIELAESEYKKIFKKYREYDNKLQDIESYLYNMHYQYMLKYVRYKDKYIKINLSRQTIYMYVMYEIFKTYEDKDGKQCYEYELKGEGYIHEKDALQKFIYPEKEKDCYTNDEVKGILYDSYNVTNNLKIYVSNDRGKIGPRKPEDIEIISKEEYENNVKTYLKTLLKNYESN